MAEWRKRNDALGTANRGDACESGLCTLCMSDCKGKCETWLSSLVGRKLLYPRNYGWITSGSGNTSAVGVGYHTLRIHGYAYGAHGLGSKMTNDPDDCVFPNVSLETSFGSHVKTQCRMPIMTGALGSTFIAARYWDSFAIGAALAGIPIVIGENVVGIDRKASLSKGKITKAPELDRRIDTFLKHFDGYGAIIVQMNVEDTRNGVAQYVLGKYGDKAIIELKWGQGAKDIGGEIQVTDIEYARFLKDRGYVVDPNPFDPVVEAAYKAGALKAFARHSRLGGTNLDTVEQVHDDFMKAAQALRKMGWKRISLKTGAYGLEALAMAIKFSAEAELDLLTVDGAGGGTGMSPWNMMEHWGIPSLELHAKTYEYCRILADRGMRVPDISLAGGFAREDHLFKALAICAPFTKMVCMGRAPMIPGYLGSNIQGVLQPEKRKEVNGHWDDLSPAVKEIGSTPEEIFAGWEAVKNRVGAKEMKNIPFGAVALYTYADKLACGLQQFMAGARKFRLSDIRRDDLMSANKETAEVTGIPYMLSSLDDFAKSILKK
jgi:glutamate synthase domain-containing protein 2